MIDFIIQACKKQIEVCTKIKDQVEAYQEDGKLTKLPVKDMKTALSTVRDQKACLDKILEDKVQGQKS